MSKWLKRIKEYYRDKVLAEKCGLEAKDICVHESTDEMYLSNPPWLKCIKCGEMYR